MLKAALAFVPLLAGYLFVSTWHETRYLIKREDSQKLYIRAAFWGIWLFLLAFAAVAFFDEYLNSILSYIRSWRAQADLLEDKGGKIDTAFWLVVLVLTLGLGLFGGFLLNWILAFKTISFKELFRLAIRRLKSRDVRFLSLVYEYSNKSALKTAIQHLNADLELILMRSLEQSMPICVTLGHGKVYVGYLTGAIDPGDKRDMIRILPFVSGYRAPEGLKLHFTTWYTSLYQQFSNDPSLSHLSPDLFEIVFPLSEVKSVNLFDIDAYQAFQKANPRTP